MILCYTDPDSNNDFHFKSESVYAVEDYSDGLTKPFYDWGLKLFFDNGRIKYCFFNDEATFWAFKKQLLDHLY